MVPSGALCQRSREPGTVPAATNAARLLLAFQAHSCRSTSRDPPSFRLVRSWRRRNHRVWRLVDCDWNQQPKAGAMRTAALRLVENDPPTILSVATAVPRYRMTQEDVA